MSIASESSLAKSVKTFFPTEIALVIRINFVMGLGVFLATLGMAKISCGETIDFEDLTLSANSYWNGSASTTYFTSGTSGTQFNNSYTDYGSYTSWYGFAYSNVSNTTTAGYTNQYAVYNSTGTGYGGSGNYAVVNCNADSSWGVATMTLAAGTHLESAYFCNTTYAALAILNGDDGGFGGVAQFTSGSWFLLTITGTDASGDATGSVEIYLADYRDGKSYVMSDWTYENLSALGDATTLSFVLTSSDAGIYGINTPSYFAIDELTVVPEPGTLSLLAAAFVGLIAYALRKRKK
jgi:hypothetical protein